MSYLIEHILLSLKKTDEYKSKITDEILKLEGMTERKTRHFYNNLCSMEDTRYLEIGTWKGSSVCAAMCNNRMKCVVIDNWSEFGGPKDEFTVNFTKFKGDNDALFIEKDCWDIDVTTIGKFNIYMYDGNHDEENHYKALNHYLGCLDDDFIYLVDDWNLSDVRNGTIKAIHDNNLTKLYQKDIYTPAVRGGGWGYDWWNGIGIFVLRKNKK